jgi:hypothetical protein
MCEHARAMEESRLAALRPFAGLSAGERKMLARVMDELSAPAGATLVSQGGYGYEFMVIEDGTVDVVRDGLRVDEMGPVTSSASWPCSGSAASATPRSSPPRPSACSR